MQRVALVTGGSHRLGAALCRTLAARGWRVVIHCRSGGPDADALANEIGGIVLPYDLAGDTPERIVAMASERAGGPLDALVNNAAIFELDWIDNPSPDKMEAHWRVNLRAPMLLSAAFAAQAQGPDRSAIVHILDQKIANPNPDFPSYTASKAGLAGMVAPMAMGYRAQCRVIGVAPGILFPSYDQTDEEFQAVAAGNLIGRPIDAGHVAQTVAFVLDCPAITGQILYADNGQHLERSARDIMFLGREGA
jgi:NAD(P)-dependent dehydrogenase (short-subunit alcohol dehydrogenase family)